MQYIKEVCEELEKIALTKTLFKGTLKGFGLPNIVKRQATNTLIKARNLSKKKGLKWSYPVNRAVTGEIAKGKSDIAAVATGAELLGLASIPATKGATSILPIGSGITSLYTVATRAPSILRSTKQYRSMGKKVPTITKRVKKQINPKYKKLTS